MNARSIKLFALATVTIVSLIYPIWGYFESRNLLEGSHGKEMMGYFCSLFCGGAVVVIVAVGLLADTISERRKTQAQNAADAQEQDHKTSADAER